MGGWRKIGSPQCSSGAVVVIASLAFVVCGHVTELADGTVAASIG